MANRNGESVILIAGPTASGKSAAALMLAGEIGGEIVNADALQVYRDLSLLSARPSPADEALTRHHLFGHVDGAVRYSVGRWARDAAAALAGVRARGRPAVVVGGTGLYFRGLTKGLSEAPDIPDVIRREAEARLAAVGLDAFRAEVLAADPAMARLKPADRQRHIRAWEFWRATGRALSDIQKTEGRPIASEIAAKIVIEPPRADLYPVIDARFDAMLAAGAIDEARALQARKLDPMLPVMKAVGVAELLQHLGGAFSLDEAVRRAKQSSRRFAKRQMTWFRNQTPDWQRATAPAEAVEKIVAALKGG